MKLSRITAVVAVASIAPAVFLAAPAVADGSGAKPPVTTTQGQVPVPDPAGGAKVPADEEKKAAVTAKNFPKALTAGGEWTEFSFEVENLSDKPLKDFTLSFNLFGPEKGNGGQIDQKDPRAARLEYRTDINASTSSWQPIVTFVSPEKVCGEAQVGDIAKGAKITVDLHVLLPKSFPVGQATVNVTATVPAGAVTTPEREAVTIVAKDGGKTGPTGPEPTASATTGGGTKTKDPKTEPSPKASATATPTPSATATATATATPSASATTAAAVAGNTTTTNSGSSELAKTGAGSSTPWAVTGSAAALALGTGLVVMARRRGAAQS
ncbi:LAETG motif-containing sortase-dependent surface protein [Streptomyces syringium]|uniref:LAETG motif-containing sortase-dependent surface protein n=1 Tax=Streptomyces syringium TaxID=76729 RepID=UPI0036D0A331